MCQGGVLVKVRNVGYLRAGGVVFNLCGIVLILLQSEQPDDGHLRAETCSCK